METITEQVVINAISTASIIRWANGIAEGAPDNHIPASGKTKPTRGK
jgi:hypothetical protein